MARGRLGIEEALNLRKEVEAAIHSGVQAAETATLRPGRAVTTIASLARELKALETIVSRPEVTDGPRVLSRPRRVLSSSPKTRS